MLRMDPKEKAEARWVRTQLNTLTDLAFQDEARPKPKTWKARLRLYCRKESSDSSCTDALPDRPSRMA